MKKIIRYSVIILFIFAGGFFLLRAQAGDVLQAFYSKLFLPMVFDGQAISSPLTMDTVCNQTPSEVTGDLIAGQNMDAGDIVIWIQDYNLNIKYVTTGDWCFTSAKAQVATSLSDIPQVNGNPVPGQFDYKADFGSCIKEYTFVIPLKPEWAPFENLIIAAHADLFNEKGNSQTACNNSVSETGGCDNGGSETGWCDNGGKFPGKNWARYCTFHPIVLREVLAEYDVSTAFEDLEINKSDYDYTDWVADVDGQLTFCANDTTTVGLGKMEFMIIPQAHGSIYEHLFHLRFNPDTFQSDGVYELQYYDGAGEPTGSPITGAFIANQTNDYVVIPSTISVFDEMIANTYESHPHYPPKQLTKLTVTFNELKPFDLGPSDPNLPENIHGQNVFADTYLEVVNNSQIVSKGDSRMLIVGDLSWRWPEEGVAIWKAYPLVQQGTPPVFPPDWRTVFNTCVYDGQPCVLP